MSNPANAVWQLQSDLAGQDQSGPVSLTGVEPIRFDGGLCPRRVLLAQPVRIVEVGVIISEHRNSSFRCHGAGLFHQSRLLSLG